MSNEAVIALLQQAINALQVTAVPTAPAQTAPPGHVYLPVTGHILPLPNTDDLAIWNYVIRAGEAAGIPPGNRSMRMANIAYSFSGNDRTRWPEAVDRAGNPEAYMTPDELAAKRAKDAAAGAAWDEHWAGKPSNRPSVPVVGQE